jgi:hypothetical protein
LTAQNSGAIRKFREMSAHVAVGENPNVANTSADDTHAAKVGYFNLKPRHQIAPATAPITSDAQAALHNRSQVLAAV